MNYIIWNGINSETIDGLLICELPPITKPKIRTEVTEIDGKDGDFIDKVGYSSYDKTIKVGLFDDFDINQIIKYFSGKGEITFSNEPDKVYMAEIIDQIDLKRLVNFMITDIKFHVQPFKYLKDEPNVDIEVTNQTSISVTNQGLETSKPVITLYGSDLVEIGINGFSQFQVTIDEEYITIDSNSEDAYKDSPSNLKNRSMTGVFPTLNPGENIITWTGNLTRIVVEPKSRWI
ncbi:MAG: phage tail family protein [Candidatus Azobacteroides pseudotrichonymphae]|uniref:Phage tail family protein n=1 Tax=Candidatus Improbicoccus pseudotrichonymphae TaxID=3033792 RepID=A0AA48KV96_9FIRM|nr:MAG: phage tail family protein [Candidatus Improbicoccus pseudotrichonymphae]GMO34148.1 MAG: phage tail family protein [Candidatus Azobacteroides pseudotrichonymphae]